MKTDQNLKNLHNVISKYRSHPMFNTILDPSINSRGLDGDSMLHKAIALGDIESVKTLVDGGSNPNFIGDMGCTPLHEAVESQNFNIVEVLLEAGARPSIISEFGQSSFDVAALQTDRSILDLLRRYEKS